MRTCEHSGPTFFSLCTFLILRAHIVGFFCLSVFCFSICQILRVVQVADNITPHIELAVGGDLF